MALGSTLDKLSQKQKEALSKIYDMPETYDALIKLCELEIAALGTSALSTNSLEDLKSLHGRAIMARDLPLAIKDINKRINKKRD